MALWPNSVGVGISNPKAVRFLAAVSRGWQRAVCGCLLVSTFVVVKFVILGDYAIGARHAVRLLARPEHARRGRIVIGIIFWASGADDLVCADRHVRPRGAANELLSINADAANQPVDALCHLEGATKQWLSIFPDRIGKRHILSGLRESQVPVACTVVVRTQERTFARTETIDMVVNPLGNGSLAGSWQKKDGATVTNVQDYDLGLVHSFAALPNGQFLRITGSIAVMRPADRITDDRPHRNRELVLDAITSLFQRHDGSAVDRLYAHDYIQHNPNIPQGRDALRSIVETLSPSVRYEPDHVIALAFQMNTALLELAGMKVPSSFWNNEVESIVRRRVRVEGRQEKRSDELSRKTRDSGKKCEHTAKK